MTDIDQALAALAKLRLQLEAERRAHALEAAEQSAAIADLSVLLHTTARELTAIRLRPWRWLAWRGELKRIVGVIEHHLGRERRQGAWLRLWRAVHDGREDAS